MFSKLIMISTQANLMEQAMMKIQPIIIKIVKIQLC